MIWVFFLVRNQLVQIKGTSMHLWPLTSLPSSNDWCSKNKFTMKKTAEHQFIDKIYNCLNKIYILNCYCFEVFICKTCKMLKNTKLIRFILNLTKKMWKKVRTLPHHFRTPLHVTDMYTFIFYSLQPLQCYNPNSGYVGTFFKRVEKARHFENIQLGE